MKSDRILNQSKPNKYLLQIIFQFQLVKGNLVKALFHYPSPFKWYLFNSTHSSNLYADHRPLGEAFLKGHEIYFLNFSVLWLVHEINLRISLMKHKIVVDRYNRS